ncbi:MAG TPA: alpha/beta hydrolase [Acidimicrobiales bacterium]|nr:alpha/beta hydrolase [Acidimicrobiales bacterium]
MAPPPEYDEFGFFHENAAEFGLPYDGPPVVRRVFHPVGEGRRLSALAWGEGPPELVLLHGGAQNAHTWDTVAMALGRPLLAVDLPGHGHSDGSGPPGEGTALVADARDVAAVVGALAPAARAVVGMSLGGLVTVALAGEAPDVVRAVVLVDVLPGVAGERAKHITDFLDRPPTFASFDELLELTVQFNPTRTRSSLRRGILHNAEQLPDGSWMWRWARHRALPGPDRVVDEAGGRLHAELWDTLAGIDVPLLLARGMRSDSVLGDEDEAELRRRAPSARVVHVEGAGHSLQGDTPLELAAIIEDFVFAREETG